MVESVRMRCDEPASGAAAVGPGVKVGRARQVKGPS